MAFRVFLSHSLDDADRALAWRLQTLAAAHWIEMYVPQYGTTPTLPGALPIEKGIDRADCVLAILTSAAGSGVQSELRYAREKGKLVIPIVREGLAGSPLLARFPRVFTFSPSDDPGKVESEIVEFLKRQQITKEKQQAVGALAALGLGLLSLVALGKEYCCGSPLLTVPRSLAWPALTSRVSFPCFSTGDTCLVPYSAR